ncbi:MULTISPECIES: efflux RND transporter periplasmic adaptor subunit [Shewanella]|uniref:HlyD family efflux transporter periplasmic adaptor subunit n=1 Tax=Shewanella fidelis TaxID=173509 RepID=A0AAW8NLL8_9GAMM|nr:MULTISPECIES: HlyD family efflux transporter periplasmic adaptor subunit [Shewanella]MDR8523591.1 HlyD family efflux transporter periplasmic adaptor subunit [Shewanella fidelis]MDW4810138.1 HlyD family efflux transporter periplasmic adaptor subunit [Shewanella fidelis]MDW4814283.1 HlyD family efflux transporter periplasmic adaptor subunit [Shewanella fidelis]MDW4818374.1 HlyD family efflux transporter periplasmic adaptor subunit [Shewanella fidelis]MDW4823974.1 HlyD family efflux transporte
MTACSDPSSDGVLTIDVNRSDFKVDIPATGELEASNSTTVNVPMGLRGPQSLAWIMDNFSSVKAGDVVARMDGTRESFRLEMEELDYDRLGLDSQIQSQKDKTIDKTLNTDTKLTAEEQELADRFFSEDERVYTKIDIIDQMRNQDYLEAKMDFYGWGLDQHGSQAAAEQELIKLKQQGHKAKINRYSSNLKQMEIVAPHDGLFVAQPGWNGALPVAGDMMWSGMAIGLLPDTSKMQAKLYVLESEALGLAVGKPVTLYLDAYPELALTGELIQLDALAKAKEQDSPVNYFQITVSLDKTMVDIMQPGRQVNAMVHALDLHDVITVPNQALFQKSGEYWVYLKTSAGFKKQNVKLGNRSLNRTVITEGLQQGDTIALTTPPKRNRV